MSFAGADGYRAGLEALERILTPRRPLPVSAWASEYRVLPSKSSAEPGRWRNERIPFLAAVMDALDPRHPAPLVVYVGSAQIAKSECGLNWIGRTIHQAPGSFLCVFPTDKVARKWTRTKLDPMIGAVAALRALMPLGRRGKISEVGMLSNTVTEKHYPGGYLLTGSAGISDDVASISVPYLLLEELDRFPAALEDEGDQIELALRRLATFPRSKAFANSTPTVADNSRIWPLWLDSTMDRYFVPCVHCGHMQYLRWSQVVYPAGKPEAAAYLCEHEDCGALTEEKNKPEFLAAGHWRATHPEREAIIKGFHINGLYTPIGLGDSWGKHAVAWERARGSPSKTQVFLNTRMGETHKGERKLVAWEEVKRRAEPYPLREVPRGVLILTSGTDVQADRLETQVLGFGRDGRVTVLDYAVHRGDPTRGEVWAELDAYLAREWVNAYGVTMRFSCSMVDAGYLPEHVLNFTRPRRARQIFACRGSTNPARAPIGKPAYPDLKGRKARVDERGAERYELGVSELKHWLFEELRADEGAGETPRTPEQRHLRFSAELDDDYFRQLTAETFDPKHGWIARANWHRNEALDTYLYARAAALHHRVAVQRYKDQDWQQREQLYEPAEGAKKTAPPELGKVPIPTLGGFLPTSAKTNPSNFS